MQDLLAGLFSGISGNFETLLIFIGFIVAVSTFIVDKVLVGIIKLKPLNNSWKQVIVALVAVVLLFIGYFLQLGMFAEIKIFWQYGVLWIGILLVSFGFYDLAFIRQLLILLRIKLPPDEIRDLKEERL